MGKKRPGLTDMLGIVAQQESKGHGNSTTVPQDNYGVGVASGVTSGVTSNVISGVTDPTGAGVPIAAGVADPAVRAAASAAVLGIPASIQAW